MFFQEETKIPRSISMSTTPVRSEPTTPHDIEEEKELKEQRELKTDKPSNIRFFA